MVWAWLDTFVTQSAHVFGIPADYSSIPSSGRMRQITEPCTGEMDEIPRPYDRDKFRNKDRVYSTASFRGNLLAVIALPHSYQISGSLRHPRNRKYYCLLFMWVQHVLHVKIQGICIINSK